jgi:hypothetical protein
MQGSRSTLARGTIEPEAVSPAIFAHFVLRTSNLDGMCAWYRTLLNARVVFDNGRLCFLTYDTAAFKDNAIGVPFDPEALIRAYESGVPEAELMRRP